MGLRIKLVVVDSLNDSVLACSSSFVSDTFVHDLGKDEACCLDAALKVDPMTPS